MKGGCWLGLGGGSYNTLQFVRNMILARIIAPEAFGLMAIVLVIGHSFESFTQVGIRQAVIQYPREINKAFLNAVWWFSFARGVCLFFIAILLSPLVADFYEKPEIIPLLQVSLLTIVFNGMLNPKAYVQLKNMNYKLWVIIFHGGGIFGVLTTIVLGIIYQSIWALVIGYVVESASRAVISFLVCPYCPGFQFEKESYKPLLQYARGMAGTPILVFLYDNLDIFVLGKLIGDAELGMYSLAKRLTNMPLVMFTNIISPLFMPTLASIQQNQREVLKVILKVTKHLGFFVLPFFTILICFSSEILTIVYGSQYAAVSTPFMILCSSLMIKMQMIILTSAYFSIGLPEINRKLSFIRFFVIGVLIYPLSVQFGINGAATAQLISSAVWGVLNIMFLRQVIGLTLKKYTYSLANSVVVSSIILGVWIITGLLI